MNKQRKKVLLSSSSGKDGTFVLYTQSCNPQMEGIGSFTLEKTIAPRFAYTGITPANEVHA